MAMAASKRYLRQKHQRNIHVISINGGILGGVAWRRQAVAGGEQCGALSSRIGLP